MSKLNLTDMVKHILHARAAAERAAKRSKTYGAMPVSEHEVWAHNAQVSTRQVRRAEQRRGVA